MDPISLSLAIAPLVLSSAKILAGMRSIRRKYKSAESAIAMTQTECGFMHVALCEVQTLVQKSNTESTMRLQSQGSIEETFDKVLTGCRITIDALTLEVNGVLKSTHNSKDYENIGFSSKAQYIWKEESMQELMTQLKNQRDHIQFLIAIMQSGTQAEILRLVQQNARSIQNLLNKAKSIRSLQGFDDTQSVFATVHSIMRDPLKGSFEEQLHQSPAYRKAQAAAAEDLLAAKLELLEEKYNLEETIDKLRTEIEIKDEALRLRDEALLNNGEALASAKEDLTLKNAVLVLKEKDAVVLDQISSQMRQEIEILRKDKISNPRNLDSSLTDYKNLHDEMKSKESVMEDLKANGYTWMSVGAFNWAAANGKVGPFQLGEYNSSFRDPITTMNYLHTASAYGHVDVVKFLLGKNREHMSTLDGDKTKETEKCFDIDERTSGSSRFTALQLASQEGHYGVVMELLRAQADANAVSEGLKGQTALEAAAANGHIEIVQALLDRGVLMFPNLENWSAAIRAAAMGGHENVVKKLRAANESTDYIAMKYAADSARWDIVKALWANRIDTNNNQSSFAIEKDVVETVNHLLRDKVIVSNTTVLYLSMENGKVDLIKYMLGSHGKARHLGWVALVRAVSREYLQIVDVILQEKVWVCSEDGTLAVLIAAIDTGNPIILERLLESAFELEKISFDCSRAYEQALESVRSHPQRAILEPILENSDFGKDKRAPKTTVLRRGALLEMDPTHPAPEALKDRA